MKRSNRLLPEERRLPLGRISLHGYSRSTVATYLHVPEVHAMFPRLLQRKRQYERVAEKAALAQSLVGAASTLAAGGVDALPTRPTRPTRATRLQVSSEQRMAL
jgi:hypothetical protein